jgi:hypothetical protein
MPPDEVVDYYHRRTSMQGRYRVMEHLEGTGPGCIRGVMVYQETFDFPRKSPNRYHYSPYLLEGLLHVVNFYVAMRDEAEERHMIPAGLEELRFSRPCRPGERLSLEARLLQEDPQGFTWAARALDESGEVIMQAQGLRVVWFAE